MLRRIVLLNCLLRSWQHQAEAVALVSRTLRGAVGDVAAIGRIGGVESLAGLSAVMFLA